MMGELYLLKYITKKMNRSPFKKFLINQYLNFRSYYFRLLYGYSKNKQIPKNIKKILLCRFDRLGDLILSTSILPALKHLYPNAQIDIVVSKGLKDILFGNIYINRVYGINYSNRKSLRTLSKKLDTKNYDLSIDLSLSRGCLSSIFLKKCNAKFMIGFSNYKKERIFDISVTDGNFNEHFIINIYKLIQKLGYKDKIYNPGIFFLDSEKIVIENLLKKLKLTEKYMVIHPGAFYKTQRFSIEKMVKIADIIYEKYCLDIIFVGGSNDKFLLDSINFLLKNRNIKIYMTKSLRELLYILKKSSIFFGNNSGPLHVAAALNIPTISTIGPTMGDYFYPWGKNNTYINLNLPCSPCFNSECSHHSCLENISVDSIIKEIDFIVSKI